MNSTRKTRAKKIEKMMSTDNEAKIIPLKRSIDLTNQEAEEYMRQLIKTECEELEGEEKIFGKKYIDTRRKLDETKKSLEHLNQRRSFIIKSPLQYILTMRLL